MKILISGANGLIGSALCNRWKKSGHFVAAVQRHDPHAPYYCNWQTLPQDLHAFEGFDLFIHLAGESIAGIRWTARKKTRLMKERSLSNQICQQLIMKLQHPPKQIIIASGVGYYGADGSHQCDENSSKGCSFLSDLASAIETGWKNFPIPTVLLRIATVMNMKGGALKKIAAPWKFKILFYFGSQHHFFPYIMLEELIDLFDFIVKKMPVAGVINACSKEPRTQGELFQKLSHDHKILCKLTLPRFLLILLMGDLAKETVLIDQKVVPQRLIAMGFFQNRP